MKENELAFLSIPIAKLLDFGTALGKREMGQLIFAWERLAQPEVNMLRIQLSGQAILLQGRAALLNHG